MNLHRAAIFVRVVDEAGFTAAARALGLPKSAVSQAVSRLEQELGVRLLNRSSRAVTVTEAGALLHRRAAPALRALDEVEAEVVDAQGPLRGRIRMTAPVEVATRLLEPHLSRFLALHPDVKLELTLTSRVLDLAEEGIDLAVRGGPVHDEGLVARKLGVHDAGLFAAPSYLRTRGRPRRVADLANHDCVVYRPTAGRGVWTLSGPKQTQHVEVQARLGVDHFSYMVRAVRAGVGIGLLPLFLSEPELSRGELVRVLPKYALRDKPLQLPYSSRCYISRPVAALRDYLLDKLG
jgi:DNA-binding transcriptional LysR family regulator